MPINDVETSLWRQHGFEIFKTIVAIVLSILLSIAAYVWHTTMDHIEEEMAFHRKYLDLLSERVRTLEISIEGNRASNLGVAQRLDRLEELNYGYRQRNRKGE